mgnify:CR=1 FL=1
MKHDLSLKNPADLYQKLLRESKRVKSKVDSDNLFNFIVTAYHLTDWIGQSNKYSEVESELKRLRDHDKYYYACRDIANAVKHFKITRYVPETKEIISSSGYGKGRFGKGLYGVGEESIVIVLSDDSRLDLLDFVEQVVKMWKPIIDAVK